MWCFGLFLKVIVGVHSDESIIKLKNRVPIDNTEKRMANIKKYADQVKFFPPNLFPESLNSVVEMAAF